MKHDLTVTLNNGKEYDCPGVDTATLAGMIAMTENAYRQTVMMPLEWHTQPGPQRRYRHHQAHVKAGHVSSIEARPSLWTGVRSSFIQEKTVWEVNYDALGTGHPVIPTLVRVEELDGDYVVISVVSPTDPANGIPSPGRFTLETFVEATSPVSVDRLMDHGVALADGDTIGRWPTDEEMREWLNS